MHLLNTLSPYTHILLMVGILWHTATQFCLDRARRKWRKKSREERARREAAETANRAKAVFLTSMSHEIRAPLNAIVGFTQLALKTPLHPELREYLDTVNSSAGWLTHVVNEIMDFSRMEAGVVQLSSEAFSIRDILKSAVNIAQPHADQRKLLLRLHLDAALPNRVLGDSTRLLQVIYNLIENATKFSTTGCILVTAVLEQRAGDTATIRISVADTGIGIPAEKLGTLFEPLTSRNLSLDRRARTCGFGLPICQRLVELMGGSMDVRSQPGIGSTFSFALPLAVMKQKEAVPATVSASPDIPGNSTNRTSLSILVADDDSASRALATVLLHSAGHHVTEAHSGLDALKHFTTGNFHLVLMDIEMAGLSGIETTKAIRATEAPGQQTPIYALTAHTGEADKDRCLSSGMNGFLSKPLNAEALLNLAHAIASSSTAKAHATL